MGGIDWLFGAVLAGFAVRGLCRGLLLESLAFFGLLASTAVALAGAGRTSAALAALGVPGLVSLVLAGAGLFLLGLLCTDGAERLARTRLKEWRRTRTDRAGGALAGLLKGALLLSLAAALLLHDAVPGLLRRPAEEGALPRLLAPASRILYQVARPLIPAGLLERGKALAVEWAAREILQSTPAEAPRRSPVPRVRPA